MVDGWLPRGGWLLPWSPSLPETGRSTAQAMGQSCFRIKKCVGIGQLSAKFTENKGQDDSERDGGGKGPVPEVPWTSADKNSNNRNTVPQYVHIMVAWGTHVRLVAVGEDFPVLPRQNITFVTADVPSEVSIQAWATELELFTGTVHCIACVRERASERLQLPATTLTNTMRSIPLHDYQTPTPPCATFYSSLLFPYPDRLSGLVFPHTSVTTQRIAAFPSRSCMPGQG